MNLMLSRGMSCTDQKETESETSLSVSCNLTLAEAILCITDTKIHLEESLRRCPIRVEEKIKFLWKSRAI